MSQEQELVRIFVKSTIGRVRAWQRDSATGCTGWNGFGSRAKALMVPHAVRLAPPMPP